MKRYNYIIWVLPLLLCFLCSCGNSQQVDYQRVIDSLEIELDKSNRRLAVDPDLLQLRIDSMERKKGLIDSVIPGIDQRMDEVGVAYATYVSALLIFQEYVKQYDPLMYDHGELQKELLALEEKLKKDQLDNPAETISEMERKVAYQSSQTKQLARAYINIIQPYKRKKKIIDHMYNRISAVDMDE